MFARRPKTPDEIGAEIADLARRRDRLLRDAPKYLFVFRLLMPLMVVVPLVIAASVVSRHGGRDWRYVLFLLIGAALVGRTCIHLWRPGERSDDPWAVSDRVNFEDGPRELQSRIDMLERELRERG